MNLKSTFVVKSSKRETSQCSLLTMIFLLQIDKLLLNLDIKHWVPLLTYVLPLLLNVRALESDSQKLTAAIIF